MDNSNKLFQTKDGSFTLYNQFINDHYHSVHGALTESRHIFIHAGLNFLLQKGCQNINLLEVGFGTGLNCLLSFEHQQTCQQETTINYTGIDPYPITIDQVKKLDYKNYCSEEGYAQFIAMHSLPFDITHPLSPAFNFVKKKITIESYTSLNNFHLVYFDAFAPNKQAEMWDKSIFLLLWNALKEGGVLITYCAKGSFKRTLKEIGFRIESLPGPPGKREITRAIKLNQ